MLGNSYQISCSWFPDGTQQSTVNLIRCCQRQLLSILLTKSKREIIFITNGFRKYSKFQTLEIEDKIMKNFIITHYNHNQICFAEQLKPASASASLLPGSWSWHGGFACNASKAKRFLAAVNWPADKCHQCWASELALWPPISHAPCTCSIRVTEHPLATALGWASPRALSHWPRLHEQPKTKV